MTCSLLGMLMVSLAAPSPQTVSREEAAQALSQAVGFFSSQVAVHGGYPWRTSADLTLREGEDEVDSTRGWVQPPGTPAVGEAILNAYDATRDPALLEAAHATARALIRGQLRSGGWDYWIEFDPAKRQGIGYRDEPAPPGKPKGKTQLDDETTQAALRFLIELDRALDFRDAEVGTAAHLGLEALLKAQHPNGGWYVWWTDFPGRFSEAEYPVRKASYPADWSREWTKDYKGRYVLNDGLVEDVVHTLLVAHQTYADREYLDAASRAGDFLILAQMPEPQPAWAQQYDVEMHPAWARKFEPPAISGSESQGVIRTLLELHHATGDAKFLEPIPRALDYLRRSQIEPGRLARFYELETNRPLYFTKDYRLTYDRDDLPTHYSFIGDAHLDRLQARLDRERSGSKPLTRPTGPSAADVRRVIDAMDDRGAWAQPGNMRGFDKVSPKGGVLESSTFIRNVGLLADYLRAHP